MQYAQPSTLSPDLRDFQHMYFTENIINIQVYILRPQYLYNTLVYYLCHIPINSVQYETDTRLREKLTLNGP